MTQQIFPINNGTLVASSASVANLAKLATPKTVVFNSASVSRKISVSYDSSGSVFFDATPKYTDTNQIVVVVEEQFRFIKFTGAVGDTYEIY